MDPLLQHIHPLIEKNGWIPFSDYMQAALYTPGLGYYFNALPKFGAQGDFVTAPDVSTIFSQSLAAMIVEWMEDLPHFNILEVGAGNGQLAHDLLQALARLNRLPEHYYIKEISPALITLQKHKLATQNVQWVDDFLPNFEGIILANEVMDAFPVRLLNYQNDSLLEWGVGLEQGHLSWQKHTPTKELADYFHETEMARYCSEIFRSEAHVQLKPWIHALSASLKRGHCLLIDYGYPRREWFAHFGGEGSLRCFYQHQVHGDPFFKPGLQDITAHVDFTRVAECAVDSQLDVSFFSSQGLCIASYLPEMGNVDWQTSKAIQTLTAPQEMGEVFKWMLLSRDRPEMSERFQRMDRRFRL